MPALNEEKNVGRVLEVLLSSKDLDEVILVDDGSTDKTAEIGEKMGAKVVRIAKNSGKGNAMVQGIKRTDAGIIVFFDADLIGLTVEHIALLVEPMLKEEVKMCVGARDRSLGLPEVIIKIDPLMAIGGERAIRRELLENIPKNFIEGFAIEIALNQYCQKHKLSVKYVTLKNLTHVVKEKKWGLAKGFSARVKMIFQIIKIRLAKNEFKKNI